MAGIGFIKSLGDIPFETAQAMTALRDLPAEALYMSGATNHEHFMEFRDLPAEALFFSGATNHERLFSLNGLSAEALQNSGATAHDTTCFSVNSPYVCPEVGNGVITDYDV